MRVQRGGPGRFANKAEAKQLRAYKEMPLAEMAGEAARAAQAHISGRQPADKDSPAAPGRGGAGTPGSVGLAMALVEILLRVSAAAWRPRGRVGLRGGGDEHAVYALDLSLLAALTR